MTPNKTNADQQILDKLGQELKVGDYVVTAHGRSVYVCSVVKFTAKMVKLKPLKARYLLHRYCHDTVKLQHEAVTWHILRNSE